MYVCWGYERSCMYVCWGYERSCMCVGVMSGHVRVLGL